MGIIIPIDRTNPFDPIKFIGGCWTSGVWTIKEQDDRSLALKEMDFTKISFLTMLEDGEKCIDGEKKLQRLKESGHIRLDAKIFQTFWENQYLIPEKLKEEVGGNAQHIFFDGTILRSPDGYRYVLYLYWDFDGWNWHYLWLGHDRNDSDPSAVLASTTIKS